MQLFFFTEASTSVASMKATSLLPQQDLPSTSVHKLETKFFCHYVAYNNYNVVFFY